MGFKVRFAFVLLVPIIYLVAKTIAPQSQSDIIAYTVSPENIKMFHQDDQGRVFMNFHNLKDYLSAKNKTLKFAMNGGMYLKDLSPQGLYIERGKRIKKANRISQGYGNFYLQPNGVFFITKNKKAFVVATKNFRNNGEINYATQSGPMLVIDGNIHPKFSPTSQSKYIRNGVGILPDGNLLFAISTHTINFYNFASFFKDKGCKNALYLDGFVSRIYLPREGITEQDGLFGIIIGEVESKMEQK